MCLDVSLAVRGLSGDSKWICWLGRSGGDMSSVNPCSIRWGKNEHFFVVIGADRINER